MFKMSFLLKKTRNGSLSLVLPVWFRILFLFIVIILSAGIFVSDISTSGQWIPILIIIVCITGALYEEKWIFNKSKNTICYISGTLVINKKKIYKFDNIENFKISGEFHSENEGKLNRLRKKMAKFSLIFKSGEVMDIDITTGKTTSEELIIKAKKIANYCGIQLTENIDQ
ncbi:MAG: hypothetical protein J7L71_02405 [Spirochaetaceae bacterium]|nr:hypothetical protein [Spirochaetaceae bacterium]